VRSGAHVDPLTRHSPALRSTGRIMSVRRNEKSKRSNGPVKGAYGLRGLRYQRSASSNEPLLLILPRVRW